MNCRPEHCQRYLLWCNLIFHQGITLYTAYIIINVRSNFRLEQVECFVESKKKQKKTKKLEAENKNKNKNKQKHLEAENFQKITLSRINILLVLINPFFPNAPFLYWCF